MEVSEMSRNSFTTPVCIIDCSLAACRMVITHLESVTLEEVVADFIAENVYQVHENV